MEKEIDYESVDRRCREKLGVSADYVGKLLQYSCGIPSYYASAVADKALPEVVEDLIETADPDEWNSDDVQIAYGRVVAKRFGVEI